MNQEKKSLYILWTSVDAVTAEKMVLMYGHNALLKGWWEDVTIIIWGAALTELIKKDQYIITI